MNSQQQIQRMFESITAENNVFYKSQLKEEDDLDNVQKIIILQDLFQRKPNIFLERYHQYIKPEFIPLFSNKECEDVYLDRIKAQSQMVPRQSKVVKNYRYLAMQELRREGSYFSNEKMREREPYLFEIMVERYMNDNEKHQLRPTVEITETNGSGLSKLLDQFDTSQRVSDRRRRYLEEFQTILDDSKEASYFLSHVENRTMEADEEEQEMGADFTMEFDSSDEEGREVEQSRILRERSRHSAKNDDTLVMRRFRDQNATLKLKTENQKASESLSMTHLTKKLQERAVVGEDAWSSGDEFDSEPTGLLRDQLYEEFISLMEQRFLDGDDAQFFDYSQVDAGHGLSGYKEDKIYEQDMEDAYFDSEEPD